MLGIPDPEPVQPNSSIARSLLAPRPTETRVETEETDGGARKEGRSDNRPPTDQLGPSFRVVHPAAAGTPMREREEREEPGGGSGSARRTVARLVGPETSTQVHDFFYVFNGADRKSEVRQYFGLNTADFPVNLLKKTLTLPNLRLSISSLVLNS